MTIRYTCPGCESVLKIKDEKAGTDAKCPKCKRAFVVPQPEEDDGIEIESAPSGKITAAAPVDLPIDLPVDMPIELTPEVPAGEEFDPADVLSAVARHLVHRLLRHLLRNPRHRIVDRRLPS